MYGLWILCGEFQSPLDSCSGCAVQGGDDIEESGSGAEVHVTAFIADGTVVSTGIYILCKPYKNASIEERNSRDIQLTSLGPQVF